MSREPFEHELAALLCGLRARGFAVGTDDALRIAALFRHARGWSHDRRVRALGMLLARDDEERETLAQLAPLLFVGAEPEDDKTESTPAPPAEKPKIVWSRAPADPEAKEPSPEPEEPEGKRRPRRWQTAAVVALPLLVALGWQALLAPAPPPPPPPPPTTIGNGVGGTTPPPPSLPIEHSPRASAEPEFDLADPQQAPRWPFVALALLSLVPPALYLARRRRAERQEQNLVRVATSRGGRDFRLRLPPPRRHRPLARDAVREAAFHLIAPSAVTRAPWIDVHATLEETARQAGRLVLSYAQWREHRALVLIQDVAPSMARWEGFAPQVAATIQRQGGAMEHVFMRGSPDPLYVDPDLGQSRTLRQVLARHVDPAVVVISDAANLDSAARRYQSGWAGLLSQATWLHPSTEEHWGPGARWLAERLRVVPMTSGGLMRLGVPRPEVRRPRRWRPPRTLGDDATQHLASVRGTLGEPLFWWLAAAAELDRVGALTVELWWALVGEGVVSADRSQVGRVWALDALKIGADGTIRIESELRQALLATLERERPELLSRVVAWAEGLVTEQLEGMADDSLGALEGRMLRSRLLLGDPSRHAEARRQAKQLADEGFGRWIADEVTEAEAEPLARVRLERTQRPSRGFAAVAVAGILGLLFSLAILAIPGAGRWLFPARPDFQILGPEPWIVSPEEPLIVYDRYQLGDQLQAWIGDRPITLTRNDEPGEPIHWRLAWTDSALATVERPGTIELEVGYGGRRSGRPFEVGLYEVGKIELAAWWAGSSQGGYVVLRASSSHEASPSGTGLRLQRNGETVGISGAASVIRRPSADEATWWAEAHAELEPTEGPSALSPRSIVHQTVEVLSLARSPLPAGSVALATGIDMPSTGGPWDYQVRGEDSEGRPYRSELIRVHRPTIRVALKGTSEIDAEGSLLLRWSIEEQSEGFGVVDRVDTQSATTSPVPSLWTVLRDGEPLTRTAHLTLSDQPPGGGPWTYRVEAETEDGLTYRSNDFIVVQSTEDRLVNMGSRLQLLLSSIQSESASAASWNGIALRAAPPAEAFFVVVRETETTRVGTILSATRWDGQDYRLWQLRYGWASPDLSSWSSETRETPSESLWFLGDTWDPVFVPLARILHEGSGGDPDVDLINPYNLEANSLEVESPSGTAHVRD